MPTIISVYILPVIIFVCVFFAPSSIADNMYYNFDIPWHGTEGVIDMSSRILTPPAGKFGRVIAKGDKITFEDGTPAKFWGVGLTFSGGRHPKFPPDQNTSQALVKKLAQYGFNHVRFVGLDNSGTEPYMFWLKKGD
ncbi:MAG: hypothetical protein OEV64_15685, partial [Desulfobulbaceae bacterium]|nr:hypothetical protein [Desulfobulbaceae bacterium]